MLDPGCKYLQVNILRVNYVVVANIFDVLVVFHLTVELVIENIAKHNSISGDAAQFAQRALEIRNLQIDTLIVKTFWSSQFFLTYRAKFLDADEVSSQLLFRVQEVHGDFNITCRLVRHGQGEVHERIERHWHAATIRAHERWLQLTLEPVHDNRVITAL